MTTEGSWGWGIWWVRTLGVLITLRAPWNAPLFSERNGLCRPVMRLGGWRLFSERVKARQ